jgi:hypothetical protein
MQVSAHQIAAVVEHAVIVCGAGRGAICRVKYHATLPGAVRLDGSIAPAGNVSSVQAAGAGPGRYVNKPSGDQCGGRSCDDVLLHGSLL